MMTPLSCDDRLRAFERPVAVIKEPCEVRSVSQLCLKGLRTSTCTYEAGSALLGAQGSESFELPAAQRFSIQM
jgi:hypothetical protein